MSKKFVSIGLLLALLSLVVGCSVDQGSTPTISLATAVPTSGPAPTAASATNTVSGSPSTAAPLTAAPTTSGSTVTQPTAASTSNGGGDLSTQTLADVEGKLFTLRVDPTKTSASYAVNEVLFGNAQVTRGSTQSVAGEFQIGVKDGKLYFADMTLRVDLRTLQSDNGLRDRALRRQWLESDSYPFAEFVATDILNFPADAKPGQDVTFQVKGNMTIHNTTKPVTFDISARLDGNTLNGTGTTKLLMTDFGVTPPDIAGRFKVENEVTLTVKGVATIDEG